ncbi:hypothetical protein SCLCIDRAFT_1219280 [Scleroderma citrinum Foug A]|uniref:Uncharacterized protein n=1 Tax=Scleroderma citrinum Foug A TaxID=1036808 RepID=A0A0C2Z6J8_9AGAM|nr:hypothetical protein SCLCIDRAFT_1219280 [Scleroderma citrinum Foug A]
MKQITPSVLMQEYRLGISWHNNDQYSIDNECHLSDAERHVPIGLTKVRRCFLRSRCFGDQIQGCVTVRAAC